MSMNPSARNRSATTSWGATQMLGPLGNRTVVVSGGPSAAHEGVPSSAAPAIPESPARKRRRLALNVIGCRPVLQCSRLQHAFQFVEEEPIRVLCDERIGGDFGSAWETSLISRKDDSPCQKGCSFPIAGVTAHCRGWRRIAQRDP